MYVDLQDDLKDDRDGSFGGDRILPTVTLLVAEELGGDPMRALAAAASAELIRRLARVRDDEPRRMDAQAINAGDLLLAAALGEALGAGEAVLGRILSAVVETIEERANDALARCTCDLGGIVADASGEVRNRLDRIGREIGRAIRIAEEREGGLDAVLSECRRIPFSEEGMRRMTELCAVLRRSSQGGAR